MPRTEKRCLSKHYWVGKRIPSTKFKKTRKQEVNLGLSQALFLIVVVNDFCRINEFNFKITSLKIENTFV